MIGEAKPTPQPQPDGALHEGQAPQPGGEHAREIGGRDSAVSAGLEPTRYGDWEKNGRCIDF